MRQARHLVWLLLSVTAFATAQGVPSAGAGSIDIDSHCTSLTANVKNGDALFRVCGFALSLKQKLPNFTCDQTLKRFYLDPTLDTNRAARSLSPKEYDTVTMRVQYESGRERYSNIVRNDVQISDLSLLGGAWSEGEFGSFLRGVFKPESNARFRFRKKATLRAKSALVFEYRIDQKANNFWLLQVWTPQTEGTIQKSRVVKPGIRGEVWVTEADPKLLWFTMEATDVASDFPMQGVRNLVSYADTPMGDGTTFVLPTSSVFVLCSSALKCQENRMRFENCHKFGVDTRILPTTEPVEPAR